VNKNEPVEPVVDACPLCGSVKNLPVLSFDDIPVFANVLFDTAVEARAAQTGRLDLVVCTYCGLLYNLALDMSLLEYSPAYENSLHHSAVFQDYASELARRLVGSYGLEGRNVVEIGPGNGDFLTMMVSAGAAKGIGFDPSHDPDRAVLTPGVEIHAQLYPETLPPDAAAVTCRHVVEHLEEPGRLLDAIRASLSSETDAVVYIEVPDATYMIENMALWDLIYEHVTYSSEQTLNWACERAGLTVLNSGRTFGDQYLWNETARADSNPALTPPDPRDFIDKAVAFGSECSRLIEQWGRVITELAAEGPLVVWGAGSKGTSFLSLVAGAERVDVVVDVNPAKKDRFIPVGGQRIVGPEALVDSGVANVIVMNPIYTEEIRTQLGDLGLGPEIHAV